MGSSNAAAAGTWHVSPPVDVSAYAFSWLFFLVPALVFTKADTGFFVFLIVAGVLTEAHRHLSLPYVFGDKEVLRVYPLRFVALPVALLLLFMCAPFLAAAEWTVAGVRPGVVLNTIATFGFLWNIWHVFAQKYGILRMYDAKAGDGKRVDGAVDRWLVFAWVPLYFTWVGPTQAAMFRKQLSRGGALLEGALSVFTAAMPVAVPLAVVALVAAHVVWLVHEHRAHRLRNRPRLVMAAGTTLLGSTFVAFDYRLAFGAFAFSHAVEYIVFLAAYMKKKYANPLPHDPWLGRVLKRPKLAYAVFFIGLGLLFTWAARWGGSIAPDAARPMFLGHRLATWLFWWMLFQSLLHFYWDGFLWKMRRPEVRAHL
jgi:hypothetical protein